MGSLSALDGHRRIYLDTNIIIYAVEAFPRFSAAAHEIFNALSRGVFEGVTSELTLAEVLVKPIRDDLVENERTYRDLLANGNDLHVVPVGRDVLIEAARLRAESPLQLPDALHVATARHTGCSAFVTNDERLKNLPGVATILLKDLAEP